jgi:hypothetical protein
MMGPKAQDRLAEALEANAEVQGHILTELRLQRATLARISARLALEVDDRIEGDGQLGKVQVEHARKLALVGMGGE